MRESTVQVVCPRRRSSARAAFSLIELLLVLVILAILIGVVATRFTGRARQAQVTRSQLDISNLSGQLNQFEIDNSRYPSSEEGLMALIQQPANAANWRPYLDKNVLPTDPWGNPYIYRYPGVNNPNGFDLYSFGPDGREGSDDITNWAQ
jgi:general secretion pathway protein G